VWAGRGRRRRRVSVGINGYGAVARSISAEQVERWETIDATVERGFGHLELGEIDLRELAERTTS
jgi:hypothetical protein